MKNANREHGGILVLAEKEGQEIASITFELMGMGRKIAEKTKEPLYAAMLGHGIANSTGEISQFVDRVYSLDHPLLASFQAELYAGALEQLCRILNPGVVLLGHTLSNLDLAPRFGFRMEVQTITDCIQLSIVPETGNLLCHKPVYGGKT